MDLRETENALLRITEDGPVSGWVDRIGKIARKAGLPLHQISWQGSPQIVAFHVIDLAQRHGLQEQLERIILEK